MSREMKNSCIPWIGMIPSTWQKIKVKQSGVKTGSGTTPKSEISRYYGGSIPWIQSGDLYGTDRITSTSKTVTGDALAEYSALKTYKKPFIVLAMYGASVGNIAISDIDACVNQACCVILPDTSNDISFLKYWLMYCKSDFIKQSVGSGQPNISQDKILNQVYVKPSISEQNAIAYYLDSHCSAIDSAISKHQQIIEKLEEYRKAVITQAVTKGLNPNVEMKDCSDKWFGNIPAEWTVKRLKYLFQTGDGQLKIGPFGSALKGKTIENGPYKIYNQANVIQNDFSISRHYVSDETYDELKAYTVLPDDVLFTMMGTIGKCQIMPHNTQPGIMDSHLLKARLNGFVLPEYFVYAYDKDNTDIIYNQLIFMTTGSIMNGLNSSIIKEIRMPVPPVEEQRRIVSYLDKMCGKIDTAIEKHNQLISKLQEYKQSLIYNAVTGKIDCTTEA